MKKNTKLVALVNGLQEVAVEPLSETDSYVCFSREEGDYRVYVYLQDYNMMVCAMYRRGGKCGAIAFRKNVRYEAKTSMYVLNFASENLSSQRFLDYIKEEAEESVW